MEKLNAYIVMTNGAINIVTTDPNVADQAKMKSPGSIVKRFPLTSKMAGSTGLVGEALDGDFEMGADDGSIGQDDVEFASDDQPQDGGSMGDEEMPMDDAEGDDDDTTDVICMNTELAIRVFEYIAQNQIDGEELQALADKMADLGNQSDDVLTVEHFDEITGDQDQGGEDEFADSEFATGGDEMSTDGMVDQGGDQGNDDIAADLELGEDAFDSMDGDMSTESDFDDSESQVTDADEQLMAQFVAGQISREELIDGLSQGTQDDYAPRSNRDPYGDDVSGAFDDEVNFDDDLDEDVQQPQGAQPTQGTQQQQQQAPAQNPAQFDGAYMNGYNTAKRGGQAQQQNINTPQGSAYNRGFMDAKANKPSVPPSKQQNESANDFELAYQAKVSSRNGKWYLVYGNGKRVPGYGPFDSRPEVQEEIADLYKSSKNESATPTYKIELDNGDRVKHPTHGTGKVVGKLNTGSLKIQFDNATEVSIHKRADVKHLKDSKSVKEGVETFGAFLAAMDKKTDRSVVPTIKTLFTAKKQKAAEAEKHFDIEQDPNTSAIKITNTSTVVPKR
jgi:hypothetical protein